MKIRTDFVTNSSSSSFIVAKKHKLSQNDEHVIAQWAIDQMLGNECIVAADAEDRDTKIEDLGHEFYYNDSNPLTDENTDGYDVYANSSVDFDYISMNEVFSDFFDMIKTLDGFKVIEDDIHY